MGDFSVISCPLQNGQMAHFGCGVMLRWHLWQYMGCPSGSGVMSSPA